MKYTQLCALLALEKIELHTNMFGNTKPNARFDEETLEKIEAALQANDTSSLEASIVSYKVELEKIQNAINTAIELNRLDVPEGMCASEAVAMLGKTCKAYGDSNERHTLVMFDGIERIEDEQRPVYMHEQVLNDNSKFPILK